ncbi:MAG: hypothetical protein IKD10_01320 [Lentisphaeria bacterium]|nr:hypothetical protein [Lentisphaeria bacterium]
MGKYGMTGKARQQPVDALFPQAVPSVQPANSIRRHQPPTHTTARKCGKRRQGFPYSPILSHKKAATHTTARSPRHSVAKPGECGEPAYGIVLQGEHLSAVR